MELVHVVMELWRLRLLLAVVVIAAVFAGLSLAFEVKLDPPGLHDKHGQRSGFAASQILVDTANSSIGDLRQGLPPLATRAGFLASLVTTTEVSQAIERYVGRPVGSVRTEGPSISVDPSISAAGVRSEGPVIGKPADSVTTDWLEGQTIVTVTTRAPTPSAALALSNATFAVFSKIEALSQLRSNPPPSARVRLIQLGRATGGYIEPHSSALLAAGVSVGTLIGGSILILLGAWVVTAWRNIAEGDARIRELQPLAPSKNGHVEDGHALADVGAPEATPRDPAS